MRKSAAIAIIILFPAVLASCQAFRPNRDRDIVHIEKRLTETYDEIEALYRSISETMALIARQELIIRELEAALNKGKGQITNLPLANKKPPAETKVIEIKKTAPADEKSAVETTEAEKKNTARPSNVYKRAMFAYENADYKQSISLFEQFIGDFPSHHLADNALYWKGECYYSRKEYEESIRVFNAARENYPSGNKTPDSLLKIGYAYLSLEDRPKARIFLKKVITEYPNSAPAVKASEKLLKMTG